MRFHNQCLAKLGLPHADADHLHVGDADIEGLHQVGVPHQAHVGDKEGPQAALLAAQVPHPIDLQLPGQDHDHDHVHHVGS